MRHLKEAQDVMFRIGPLEMTVNRWFRLAELEHELTLYGADIARLNFLRWLNDHGREPESLPRAIAKTVGVTVEDPEQRSAAGSYQR